MSAPEWKVAPSPSPQAEAALGALGRNLGSLARRLLINRGVTTADAAAAYLDPVGAQLADPYQLPDMEAAVSRLARAVRADETIGVLGDFDVDGLTAAALLIQALQDAGASVVSYIPSRAAEGHGIPRAAVETFHARGASLIVTVDTGSSDRDEIAHAAALGIDTVVTDHHIIDADPPPACAFVNPFRTGGGTLRTLSGAGVALMVARALRKRLRLPPGDDAIALAALGTIADVAPLTGQNRVIAARGLRRLGQTTHPGLMSLASRVRERQGPAPIDTEYVAFQLAPRLNAAGRLGNADTALRLLVTEDADEADSLSRELDRLNRKRQDLSREALMRARSQIAAEGTPAPVIAVVDETLEVGILGPLAGRLCHLYERPAAVITFERGGAAARGSLRSVPGFDIHAALAAERDLLTRFGGHARAAGFTAPASVVPQLIARLRARAATHFAGAWPRPAILVDDEMPLQALETGVWAFVQAMEPFGEGNPRPLFLARDLVPSEVRAVGAGGDHLRLKLQDGSRSYVAVGFGLGASDLGTGRVDAVYSLRTSYWRGRRRQELELKAIRPART